MTTLVGVLELASKYRYGLTSRGAPLYLFKPYDEAWPDVVVGSTERDTTRNQIAIVSVDAALCGFQQDPAAPKPRGLLQRLLGPVGDYAAERMALLMHYCPVPLYKSGEPLPESDESDDTSREEISANTGWTAFHVDPPGCRDIDDAIAWHPERRMWAITIADAAAAVPEGSLVDKAAYAMGATFYDTKGTVCRPMLPSAISEESASLLPGTRRRGVSYIYSATDTRSHWALTWITVAHSFTYETFPGSEVAAALGLQAVDPHDWIADAMIRYNAAAATLLHDHEQGLLRVQKGADADAVAVWTAAHPALARLGVEAARYEPSHAGTEQGHASLGLTAYCHASSPLRRYADLYNQRVLKSIIRSRPTTPPPAATASFTTTLNERARANRRWARDLTFLEQVTPGRVHEIRVIWMGEGCVWVPAWSRVLRLRHDEKRPVGYEGTIQIYCDPARRNWKQRVLTAPVPVEL